MKMVYEPGEKEQFSNMKSYLFNESLSERIYSLDFKVTNPALAEYILIAMMNGKLSEVDIGIDIQSINIMSLAETKILKEKLHQMIEDLMP